MQREPLLLHSTRSKKNDRIGFATGLEQEAVNTLAGAKSDPSE